MYRGSILEMTVVKIVVTLLIFIGGTMIIIGTMTTVRAVQKISEPEYLNNENLDENSTINDVVRESFKEVIFGFNK